MRPDRRALLVAMAATAAFALTRCSYPLAPWGTPGARPSGSPSGPTAAPAPSATTLAATPTPSSSPSVPPVSTPPAVVKTPVPGGTISALPGQGDLLAWTVDDGADSEVVRAYAQFVRDSGIRLTFFVTSMYPSWTDNAPLLRPLVESGQVQLANHTVNHRALTKLSDAGVVAELTGCDTFLRSTYGVDGAPFYRPPFGYTDTRTRRLAASVGYRATVMWYGTLSDSGRITPEQVVQFATEWFQPQHIVIGHANFDPVTQVYGQLLDIIRARNLRTVTLADVFER